MSCEPAHTLLYGNRPVQCRSTGQQQELGYVRPNGDASSADYGEATFKIGKMEGIAAKKSS